MKKPLLIGFGVVLILVIAGVGYAAMKKKDGTTSSMGGVLSKIAPLNSNCKYNDPDLCKFINSWKDIKYYTVTSDSTDRDGKKSTFIFKSNDKKSHVIMSGAFQSESITIDNVSYVKDLADNKWTKYTSLPQELDYSSSQTYDFDDKAEKVEDKTAYKKIGTEACGQLTCFKYQVIDPDNSDITEYIYFDNKEYQLRKMRSEGKDGSVSESTFDYSKVNISEPSPIKEATTSSSTVPANLQAEIDKLNKAASTATPKSQAASESEIKYDESADTGSADSSEE